MCNYQSAHVLLHLLILLTHYNYYFVILHFYLFLADDLHSKENLYGPEIYGMYVCVTSHKDHVKCQWDVISPYYSTRHCDLLSGFLKKLDYLEKH